MPRDLSEVLHYFMPEIAADQAIRDSGRPPVEGHRLGADPGPVPHRHPGALQIIGVPIGDSDVVRAAFLWNLSVEVARLGGRSLLLAPTDVDPSPLWPEPGVGPMGAELIATPVKDLGALYRVAVDVAVSRGSGAADGGLVFVRIPPKWLAKPEDGAALLRWMLLFGSTDTADLKETYALARLALSRNPKAQVGITIHGAEGRREAEAAFSRVARATQKCLGRDVQSYGLLVDDLHVYRAIVAQRPIGLAHPQSPAARALRDVAQMLLDDARKRSLR